MVERRKQLDEHIRNKKSPIVPWLTEPLSKHRESPETSEVRNYNAPSTHYVRLQNFDEITSAIWCNNHVLITIHSCLVVMVSPIVRKHTSYNPNEFLLSTQSLFMAHIWRKSCQSPFNIHANLEKSLTNNRHYPQATDILVQCLCASQVQDRQGVWEDRSTTIIKLDEIALSA